MRKKPWRRSASSRCPSIARPSEKVTRTFRPDGAGAVSPGASMKKMAFSSECATISTAPPPCGCSANWACERSRSVTLPRRVRPPRAWIATRCSPETISPGTAVPLLVPAPLSSTGRSRLAASASSIGRGASSSSAASDSPAANGANSGFPELDHLGASTSGDKSPPAVGGGADQEASSGVALDGAAPAGFAGGGGDQSATGSDAAGADHNASAAGAGAGVAGQSSVAGCGATAQGESLFAGGAIAQFASGGVATGSDHGVSIGRIGFSGGGGGGSRGSPRRCGRGRPCARAGPGSPSDQSPASGSGREGGSSGVSGAAWCSAWASDMRGRAPASDDNRELCPLAETVRAPRICGIYIHALRR